MCVSLLLRVPKLLLAGAQKLKTGGFKFLDPRDKFLDPHPKYWPHALNLQSHASVPSWHRRAPFPQSWYFGCGKTLGVLFGARKKALRERPHTFSIFDTYFLYF